MAKVLNLNHTDSAVSGNPTLTLPLAVLNYGTDFRIRSDEPEEVIITNLTSPIDKPEKFRFGMSEVKDIYKNSGIDVNLITPSRRGVSVLSQLTSTYSITDAADPSYEKVLPIGGHIVLKVPANELITATVIQAFVGRLVAGLFETGAVDPTRINGMIRGSLMPTDLK